MRDKPPRLSSGIKLALALGILGIAAGAVVWIYGRQRSSSHHSSVRPVKGPVTFNKHIAPIVFAHCASCHRPGESAPFSLLTYQDVSKRAKQMVEVTQRRYMPPWLPEPGYGDFVGERRLDPEQIALLAQWAAQGALEGAPSDLPPLPKWTEGWQLGQPDLVIAMPQPYTLAAEGKDIYRNFVIPIPVSDKKYVRAVEFQPGNRKIVHHAFMLIDPSRQSRKLDGQDPEPGFPGLHTPPGVRAPEGQFLSWQPGKGASRMPEGLAWALEKDCDLILQVHMQPSGKPETFQPSVGFYFTDQVPTNTPFKIGLFSYDIDIPAGMKDYVLQDQYMLPVDVDVLGVLPHAHYLGKQLQGFATLPGGKKQWLFLIKEWDFNWQGDYRYARRLFLPKGTVISMHYTYDNSADNARNPHQPPRRVAYGVQSSDEMGELWLQVLARNANDAAVLARDYQPRVVQGSIAYNQYLLRNNPDDSSAHKGLGKALLFAGKQEEALSHLRRAATTQPDDDETRYFLGLVFRMRKEFSSATAEFEAALRLNPDNGKAHGNLGFVFLELGEFDQAESHLKSALRINPDDSVARDGLDILKKVRGVGPNN
jgi:Flp pilus assembly protein TadD